MNLKAFAAGLLLAVPAVLSAQTVTYSLPKTTVTVEVDAVQESFFAGPYAAYAKRFLGIDVREMDASRSYVKEVRLVTRVEADPQARYSVDTKGVEDRFLALSSQGLVSFQDKLEAGDLVWRFNPQPLRFSELHKLMTDCSQKMLSQTLKSLEKNHLVSRKQYAEIPPRVEYTLTDLGRSLMPAIAPLLQWSLDHFSEVTDGKVIIP